MGFFESYLDLTSQEEEILRKAKEPFKLPVHMTKSGAELFLKAIWFQQKLKEELPMEDEKYIMLPRSSKSATG